MFAIMLLKEDEVMELDRTIPIFNKMLKDNI